MTIDERLERLTERHEALTQSVELLLKQTREQGQNIAELLKSSQEQGQNIAGINANISALAQIAQAHQDRLDKLES